MGWGWGLTGKCSKRTQITALKKRAENRAGVVFFFFFFGFFFFFFFFFENPKLVNGIFANN